MAKIKIQKKKLSECCGAPMLRGVQCENCGSNGDFSTGTAIIKRLDKVINILEVKNPLAKNPSATLSQDRFIDCKDGTIRDTKTGLMWQQQGSQEILTYAKAEEFITELNKEEWNDWRLPTVEELFSLIDFKRHKPAIDPIFKCESAGYWTSTDYDEDKSYAWYVYFYNGGVYFGYRNFNYYVRPVRQY